MCQISKHRQQQYSFYLKQESYVTRTLIGTLLYSGTTQIEYLLSGLVAFTDTDCGLGCGSVPCLSAGFTATLADRTEAADTAAGEVEHQLLLWYCGLEDAMHHTE